MYKNELPDLISDLKDTKLCKRKISAKKVIDKQSSRYTTQELLKRCGESTLQNAYTMDLRCEKLEIIPILKEFKHLKTLDVSSNSIKGLENLNYVNELKELKVFDNQLKNLVNLNNLKELVVLQAQYNQISDIGLNVLGACRKLKQIRLDNNCISQVSLRDFSSCSNLTYVDVSFNNLQSISFITCLPNLEEFYASNNIIEIIPDLSRCKKLSELHLNKNLISHISGIKDHKSLSILDVSNNKITSFLNLGALNQIEFLNLASNMFNLDQLKILSSTFINVEILNLNKNGFTNFEKLLEYLSEFSSLCELSIDGNDFPIINEETNEQYYPQTVTNKLTNLKILDNVSCKKTDRQNIINNGPLPMRPLTAAAGVSLKQVESQLLSFVKTVDDMQSENKSRYNDVINSLLKITNDSNKSEPSKLKTSDLSPTLPRTRKSRLVDALQYASVNYTHE